MTLTFRRAETADTIAAQQTYRRIIHHLAETVDFPHWHTEDHPTPDEVAAWIAADSLHLALDADQEVAGVVALDHQAVEGYRHADWAIDAAPEEVLVVHALGVAPDRLGRGVARFLVEAALQLAREKGCRTVRLDAYVENVPARSLYTRCGFTDLGCHTVHYEGTDLSQFHLYGYVLWCGRRPGPLLSTPLGRAGVGAASRTGIPHPVTEPPGAVPCEGRGDCREPAAQPDMVDDRIAHSSPTSRSTRCRASALARSAAKARALLASTSTPSASA